MSITAPVAATTHRAPVPPPSSRRSQLRLLALPAMAGGLLCIALGYRAGRLGQGGGTALYWIGEVVLFGAAALALLWGPQPSKKSAGALLIGLAVTTFLVRFSYSPTHFSFPDEFQHWRGTTDVLRTSHLFTPNSSLPVAPAYPGLEIVTSTLVQMTGLSVFSAALVVTGVAHVLLVAAFFALLCRLLPSTRAASLAVLIYATGPHFQSFDEIFAYQTLAVPLLVLTLLAIAEMWRDRGHSLAWGLLACLTATATILTHHVTSYVLLAFLIGIAIVAAVRDRWRAPALVAGYALAAAIAWFCWRARDTWSYLQPTLHSLWASVTGGGSATSRGSASGQPIFERVLAYASVLLILALLAWSVWNAVRSSRSRSYIAGIAAAAGLYVLTIGVRLVVSNGAELAGRALTFVLIVVAAVVGMALAGPVRRGAATSTFTRAAILVVLLVGGLVSGWPPWWERLPGRYLVDGFERSIDAQTVSASWWARQHLPANSRVAGGVSSLVLLGTYGDLTPVRGGAEIFYSPTFDGPERQLIDDQGLSYLAVDLRMSEQLPADGQYFAVDPQAGRIRHPIPRASLTKFDRADGLSRIYDNGNLVIYAIAGTGNGSG